MSDAELGAVLRGLPEARVNEYPKAEQAFLGSAARRRFSAEAFAEAVLPLIPIYS